MLRVKSYVWFRIGATVEELLKLESLDDHANLCLFASVSLIEHIEKLMLILY